MRGSRFVLVSYIVFLLLLHPRHCQLHNSDLGAQ